MPNDLINALFGRETEVPQNPSMLGAEPARPEDAIRDYYRSNAPKSSWLHDLNMKMMPGPQTGSTAQDVAGSIPTALLGMGPSGVNFKNISNFGAGSPQLRTQGKIRSMDRPVPTHSGEKNLPNVVAGQAAANFPWPGYDEFRGFPPSQGSPMVTPANAQPQTPSPASFNDRFGNWAPPAEETQMGKHYPEETQMGKYNPFRPPVPLPRPKPKKQAAPPPKQETRFDWRKSGMAHMEEGGYVNPFEPVVVGDKDGKNGEVFVPDKPGTVIPHNLAVTSGLLKAPPKSQFSSDDIFANADKPMSREEFRNTMPNIGGSIVPGGGALKAAGELVKTFPKAAAALGVAGMTSGAGEAAEPTGFPEPHPMLPKETQARLKAIDAEVKKHRETIAKHAALKDSNPGAYARRTAEADAALKGLLEEQSGIETPHKEALGGWQKRLNDYMLKNNQALLTQKQQSDLASQPFQVKHPWWNEEVQKYGSGAEGLLGAVAGITGKGKVLKPMITGAGVGGLGGALASAYPNLQDAGYLPYGSENQKKAWDQLTDSNFLKTKVLPEALAGAGVGALGAYVGSKGPTLVGSAADSVKAIAKWLKNPTGARATTQARATALPKTKTVVPLPEPVVQPQAALPPPPEVIAPPKKRAPRKAKAKTEE